jgi:hypothetical protein
MSAESDIRPSFWSIASLKDILFCVPAEMNFVGFAGRVLIFVILLLWGQNFIFDANYAAESFLHNVNLPFHEAGHIIFSPFGRLLTSLGGTLGQLLMPLICMGAFLLQTRDTFAAAVGLWWLGENFMDIAPYIADARAGVIPLLGGNTGRFSPYGFHDWEFILTETGLRDYDRAIAGLSSACGRALMIVALAWGGYILWKTYKEGI